MLLSGKRSKRSNSLWRYSGGCFEAAHRSALFRLYLEYHKWGVLHMDAGWM